MIYVHSRQDLLDKYHNDFDAVEEIIAKKVWA